MRTHGPVDPGARSRSAAGGRRHAAGVATGRPPPGARPAMPLAGTILTLTVLAAPFAPVVAPFDPSKLNVGPALEGPSGRYPMGLDNFGRDQLSRSSTARASR